MSAVSRGVSVSREQSRLDSAAPKAGFLPRVAPASNKVVQPQHGPTVSSRVYKHLPKVKLSNLANDGIVDRKRGDGTFSFRRHEHQEFVLHEQDETQQPLLRFRKAVRRVIVLLRVNPMNSCGQRIDAKHLSWTHLHDDVFTFKRSYETYDVSFDASDFRRKKEITLTNEAKAILRSDARLRTEEEQRVALISLCQVTEAFSEFPIEMQQSLVRVGWYERFESKRVIIRQGHTADNFYLIISGTAIVTLIETNERTGDTFANTVAILSKGNSFGELALMRGARRSATVTCKDDVELLAVGRDDFIDIFMHVEKGEEPDHIQFLRTIDLLEMWPIDAIPHNDPGICMLTYVRRGLLLCKNCNDSEWLYIIKTGSCRVLKILKPTKICLTDKSTDDPGILIINEIKMKQQLKPKAKHGTAISGSIDNALKPRKDEVNATEQQEMLDKLLKENKENAKKKKLEEQEEIDNMAGKTSRNREKSRIKSGSSSGEGGGDGGGGGGRSRGGAGGVVVEILRLGPGDYFGFESLVFQMERNMSSFSLVSDGAECILIKKSFFQQHLTDEASQKMRNKIHPLPSEQNLQQQLQIRTNWDAYKKTILSNHLNHKKHVNYMIQT